MIANLKCLQEIEIYIKIYNLYKDIKIILELNIFLTEHKFKETYPSFQGIYCDKTMASSVIIRLLLNLKKG